MMASAPAKYPGSRRLRLRDPGLLKECQSGPNVDLFWLAALLFSNISVDYKLLAKVSTICKHVPLLFS